MLRTNLAGTADNSAIVEEDFNEYDTGGGRIAILWNITDKWELLAGYIAQDSETNGSWESDLGLGDYKVARFFDEYRIDDWYQTSLTLTGDLGLQKCP